METIRDMPIQLTQDKELEEDVSPQFGKYLGTFVSAPGRSALTYLTIVRK